MTVESLEDVQLIESPIRYRRQYTATAILSYRQRASEQTSVTFTLEHTAHGHVQIRVTLQDEIRYPLLPVVRQIKSHIDQLEREGQLP